MTSESHQVIFHIDGDAFFASVEETVHPELRQVPMAICGNPESRRGVILSKNQRAGAYGVKTAETIWQARQKCPDLVLAPARHGLYTEFCERLNLLYQEYTDQVERLSIDESFLDVTGSLHLFGQTPKELADGIRHRVWQEIGITVSVGVSYNKIFAKMASDLKKPNGTSVITPENYQSILWSMPAGMLYSVGKKTEEKLHSLQIRTIGEIAQADPLFLEAKLGKAGKQFYNYANGFHDSPVLKITESEAVQSVGNGRTFKRDLTTFSDIRVALTTLSDTVASRLRRKNLKCTTVQVMIKDPSFKTITRQQGVAPTWLASEISQVAEQIMRNSWKIGRPIRMLTVTASNLIPAEEATEQLSLFDGVDTGEATKKRERLEQTMDSIRSKFGKDSISHGSVVNNDLGLKESLDPENE